MVVIIRLAKNFIFWVEGVFWKSQRFLVRLVQRKK